MWNLSLLTELNQSVFDVLQSFFNLRSWKNILLHFRRSSIGTFIRSHPSSESSASSHSSKPKKEAAPKLDYRSMVSIDDMPALFVSFDSKLLTCFLFSEFISSSASVSVACFWRGNSFLFTLECSLNRFEFSLERKTREKRQQKRKLLLKNFSSLFSFEQFLNVRKVKKFLDETRAKFIDDGTKHSHKLMAWIDE